MVLTKRRAQGILSAAMDGQHPAGLDDALQLLKVSRSEFERSRDGARAKTVPMHPRESLAGTDTQSRHVHGLDSDVDYDGAEAADLSFVAGS